MSIGPGGDGDDGENLNTATATRFRYRFALPLDHSGKLPNGQGLQEFTIEVPIWAYGNSCRGTAVNPGCEADVQVAGGKPRSRRICVAAAEAG